MLVLRNIFDNRRMELDAFKLHVLRTGTWSVIDLIGNFPLSTRFNQYSLVLLDSCTSFIWIFPIRNCTSKIITNVLEKYVFNAFSYPRKIISDNGSYFRSHEFKSYCFWHFILHRTITSYNATSNSSERKIKVISVVLRSYYMYSQNKWDQNLSLISQSSNLARNKSRRTTPFELMFNFKPNSSSRNLWSIHDIISDKLNVDQKRGNLQGA